jgi:3-hydroxyacyl-[acyl-carrier-protein] dehydratase
MPSSAEATTLAVPQTMDLQAIMACIPHRYPFLLVDKVVAHEHGVSMQGQKLLGANEPYFQGHFPNRPIFPGVLQLEALAQLAGVLVSFLPQSQGKLGVFAGIDEARFRRLVAPGDVLDLHVTLDKMKGSLCKLSGVASVNGQVAAEAKFMFSLID